MSAQILSIRELRLMKPLALETYKARLCLAKLSAPTDLAREAVDIQILRVNSILNEYRPLEACRY